MTAKKLLTDYVPRISKAGFDDEASSFLADYCPEALNIPKAVPIEEIATKKLGLTVVERRLTEDFSVLGQMCFTEGLSEIYDRDEDEYREIKVKPGTMIIDPDTLLKRNLGSKRMTHAHFDGHRNVIV